MKEQPDTVVLIVDVTWHIEQIFVFAPEPTYVLMQRYLKKNPNSYILYGVYRPCTGRPIEGRIWCGFLRRAKHNQANTRLVVLRRW